MPAQRILSLSMSAALLLLVGASAQAGSKTAASPRVLQVLPVSGASPFADRCAVRGGVARGAAGEPRIAVNPRDPRNIVIIHQQDRIESGGSLANVLRVSRNGGRSWRLILLADTSPCTGNSLAIGDTDPSVAFGPDRVAYVCENVFQHRDIAGPAGDTIESQFGAAEGTWAFSSRDGGRTWSKPAKLGPADPTQPYHDDRATVTTDPNRPGTAYCVFQRFTLVGNSLMFSITTDAGAKWSMPAPIVLTPFEYQFALPGERYPWGGEITVLPDRALLATWVDFTPPPGRYQIMSARSSNGGSTWTLPLTIGSASAQHPFDPDDRRQEVRDEPGPSVVVGRDGVVHVVYYSVETAYSSPILMADSRDGGRSWTVPRRIVGGHTQHFNPTIAVDRYGTLGLTYYDFRKFRHRSGRLATDFWFAESRDSGRTWHETHVAGPFDALTAAFTDNGIAAGHFIGEYMGLASAPGGFVAAFVQARPQARGGPTNIFFARIMR